ncbi:threonyl-tRNA synthetase [Streptococcus pneumoniae]|nr:threonyl-tRNA synthetase [Streptococcus pneumoniae]CKG94288.1 threonyl-tRNA synthetase [Streptococcus pneumoniae]
MKIIPVSNAVHVQYADEIADKLAQAGVRVERDVRDEKLGYKIREAQMQKVPYVLVIGDKEMENGAVNVRKYGEEKSEVVELNGFVESMKEEINNRK